MLYISRPSVQVASWARLDDGVEITYLVFPEQDTIEFTLGSHGELDMLMSEAGLRHCLAEFTRALAAFEAAAAGALLSPSSTSGRSADAPAALVSNSAHREWGGSGEPGDGP